MNADIHITEMDVMTRSYVCNNICAFSSEKGIGSFDLLRIPVGRNVASIWKRWMWWIILYGFRWKFIQAFQRWKNC